MTEDEAILFLLDIGTGATYRPKETLETVEEIQQACCLEEGDETELKLRLIKSDSVELTSEEYTRWMG